MSMSGDVSATYPSLVIPFCSTLFCIGWIAPIVAAACNMCPGLIVMPA